MSDLFSNKAILLRTSRVVVSLFRSQIEEGREYFHSRLFNFVIHPEYRYTRYGYSPAAAEAQITHPEHAVPCAFMGRECIRLLKAGKLTDDEVARLLFKHWKIVDITIDERQKIDFELGYKSTMPAGWSFEHGDSFARFKAAGIEVIADSGDTFGQT